MEKKQLQKNLGAAAALSTVVGMVIGGGVFFKPQAVYEITGGGPGLGMIAWVVAGIVAIMMSYIISQEEESRNLLFSEPLKTFLMLGATRKEIYTYPNMAQGYGILNLRNTLAAISNNIE